MDQLRARALFSVSSSLLMAPAAGEEEAGEEIRVSFCSSVNPKKEEAGKEKEEEEEKDEEEEGNPKQRGSRDCSGASPSSPPLSGSCISWQCGAGADRMVKMEIDVANTLAEFAQVALLASKSSERGIDGLTAGKWGNKRRRSRKRCKNVLRARFSVKSLPDSKFISERFQDQSSSKEDHHRHQNTGENAMEKIVKAPRDFELPKSISKRSTSNMCSHQSKLKQNLSEVEKEERRLRRVQANRESARQTIRRRQALCEELTKKAADLACDNESMKREKELAMQEYLTLKDKNKHLKEQVANMIKDEAKPSPPNNIFSQTETHASLPMQFPLLVYNGTPFTPLIWPSIMQPFNPGQTQLIHQNNTDPSCGRGGFGGNAGPRSPFFLYPCPWFLPLTDQASGSRVGFSGDGEHVTESSRKAVGNLDSASFRDGGKVSTSGSTEATTNKDNTTAAKILTESSTIFSEDKGGQILGFPSLGVSQISTFQNINPKSSGNRDNEQLDTAFKEAVSSCVTCPVGNSPENSKGTIIYQSKKTMDAAAATEARKRRKELTKHKNRHNRQLRLQC